METRQLQDLNLIDNFLFNRVIDHKEYGPRTAEIILTTIMGRKVKIGKIVSEQFMVPDLPENHGIRLDAYIEEPVSDESGLLLDVFDIEPDNKIGKKKQLPKRTRFYHSRIDGRLLPAGKNYRDLPDSWVIFITSFDPFGANRMVYTVKNQCLELPEMEFDDGAVTLFLYVKGEEGNPPRELKELLRYFGETIPENACNSALKTIQGYVDKVKADPRNQEGYMTVQEYLEYEIEEGIKKGMEEWYNQEKERRREETNRLVDEANKRVDDATRRADDATRLVDEANKRADDATRRADALEAEVRKLKEALANK